MPLEKTFKEIVEDNISTMVSAIKGISPDISEHKAIWKYDHAFDFSYGQTVGRISGLAYSVFVSQYRRPPNKSEQVEINGIIIAHAKEIRDAIKNLKTK